MMKKDIKNKNKKKYGNSIGSARNLSKKTRVPIMGH